MTVWPRTRTTANMSDNSCGQSGLHAKRSGPLLGQEPAAHEVGAPSPWPRKAPGDTRGRFKVERSSPMMLRRFVAAALLLGLIAAPASAAVKVVATTQDLAALTEVIGGDDGTAAPVGGG